MSRFLEILVEDLKQPVSYLIPAIAVSLVMTAIYVVICRAWHGTKCPDKRRAAVWGLLFCYALVMVQTAFFSREPGSRVKISLALFETWGHSLQSHAYFIENILMFIPFGVIFPILFKKRVGYCMFSGFLCSCIIEISQLITQRGYFQLDDIVTNTLGTVVGWFVWKKVSAFKKCDMK